MNVRYDGVNVMIITYIKDSKRFLLGVCHRISFVINTISGRAFSNSIYDLPVQQNSNYKAAFTFIEMYKEITNFNIKILSDILERKAILHKKQDELGDLLATTNKNINDYISFRKDECSQLATKKNQCESIYKTLEQTATKFNNSFLTLNKKLEYSAKSIQYCGDSEALIKDINTSFRDTYNKNNEEVLQNIDRIISKLNELVFKCSSMQSFPKSYNNAISMYSSKMTSILEKFEGKSVFELAKIANSKIVSNNSPKTSTDSHDAPLPERIPTRKKFCSKCGAKIEETHSQCPQCDALIYIEEA
jgi:hypothetical protein